jgi:hypothetical protein
MTVISLLSAYRQARHAMVESFINQARLNQGGKLACDGCGGAWCCYQLPLVHPIEGLVVAVDLAQDERWDLIQKAGDQGLRQMELLGSIGYVQGMSELPSPEQLDGVFGAWYQRLEPCVFLDENKQCMIYSLRPMCCSTYLTAEICKHRYAAGDLVPTLDNTSPISWGLSVGSDLLGSLLGMDGAMFTPVPLGAAVANDWLRLLRGGQ